jgi:hypothetical protein
MVRKRIGRHGKATNLELTSLPPVNRHISIMGLEDTIIKLKTSHTLRDVVKILNRDYPKPNGAKWWKCELVNYFRNYRQRCNDIAATNTSVCDKVSKVVIDTTEGVNKLNKVLNQWLDTIDTTRVIHCPDCDTPIDVFDTDKAVRVCGEIRRTLVTSHKLSGGLPDVQQTSEIVGKAVEFTQMLDKMVADGTIILVSKDEPISKQVAKALGESPKKAKPIEQTDEGDDYDENS